MPGDPKSFSKNSAKNEERRYQRWLRRDQASNQSQTALSTSPETQLPLEDKLSINHSWGFQLTTLRLGRPQQILLMLFYLSLFLVPSANAAKLPIPRRTSSKNNKITSVEIPPTFDSDPSSYSQIISSISPKASRSKKQYPKIIETCKGEVLSGKKAITVDCSDKANRTYAFVPKLFKQDMHTLQDTLDELDQKPVARCKMEMVHQNPDFKIQFKRGDEIGKLGGMAAEAQYEIDHLTSKDKLCVPLDLAKSNYTTSITEHEYQHGFMVQYHRLKKHPDGAVPYPFDDHSFNDFLKAFNDSKETLQHFDKLLAKKKQSRELEKLKKAAINYQPFEWQITQDHAFVKSMIQRKFIDDQYNLLVDSLSYSGYKSTYGRDVYATKIIKLSRYQKTGAHDFIVKFRTVEDVNDKAAAAVYDAMFMMKFIKENEKSESARYYLEVHATIHQIFDDYPELMKLLFPSLSTYDDSHYPRCSVTMGS